MSTQAYCIYVEFDLTITVNIKAKIFENQYNG